MFLDHLLCSWATPNALGPAFMFSVPPWRSWTVLSSWFFFDVVWPFLMFLAPPWCCWTIPLFFFFSFFFLHPAGCIAAKYMSCSISPNPSLAPYFVLFWTISIRSPSVLGNRHIKLSKCCIACVLLFNFIFSLCFFVICKQIDMMSTATTGV